MSAPTTPTTPAPHDLLAEGARARKLSAEVDGVKALLEGTRLLNDTVLVQVLFSLWDSGFYEYSLMHPQFPVQAAADQLGLDARVLQCLLEYLVGRDIIRAADGEFALTERGIRLSNILFCGILNLYFGGWGPLLSNIGPLLRKEMSQADFIRLRSPRHTVKGTEQLASIRAVPAVLEVVNRRQLQGVFHAACRTGEFLIALARSQPALHGIGADKSAERIAAATANAAEHGIGSRLQFITAEVGRDPWPLDPESLGKIDLIVALYLLHEVGRHGRGEIVEFLRQIKRMYAGRLFLFMETLPYVPPEGKKPPATFTQLDYLLIHRIRGQGLPLPTAEWKSIVEEAGLNLLEFKEVFGSGLYLAEL
jgi:hypothetical protein